MVLKINLGGGPRQIEPLRTETRHNLVKVGTHVLAGLRLRTHLAVDAIDDSCNLPAADDRGPTPGSVAAVLSPHGTVVSLSAAA